MTDKTTVKTSRIELLNEKKPVAELTTGGQITVPKAIRGDEDAYVIETDEHGRFVLTPVKVGYEPVAQSDD
jgi:bifunctional DNA-binding transcriptional regulator/antitoxin component of YhaV-PrlF toxin-antitoxin module